MNRWPLLLVVMMTMALALASSTARAEPSVFGHRGVRGDAPDNTQLAFEHADQQGADGVEFDVRRTKDGFIVLSHNPALTDMHGKTIKNAAGRDLTIAKSTLAELREADLGMGQHVLTLDEAIDVISPRMKMNIEIKADSLKTGGLEKEVARIIKAKGVAPRTFVSSFNPVSVARMRIYAPDVQRGLLLRDTAGRLMLSGFGHRVLGLSSINPEESSITGKNVVDRLHAKGLSVKTYWGGKSRTITDAGRLRQLADHGVDTIIHDHPEFARAAVRGKSPAPPRVTAAQLAHH
jgi:glycerophosphoryl diester phosphodiesterase